MWIGTSLVVDRLEGKKTSDTASEKQNIPYYLLTEL